MIVIVAISGLRGDGDKAGENQGNRCERSSIHSCLLVMACKAVNYLTIFTAVAIYKYIVRTPNNAAASPAMTDEM